MTSQGNRFGGEKQYFAYFVYFVQSVQRERERERAQSASALLWRCGAQPLSEILFFSKGYAAKGYAEGYAKDILKDYATELQHNMIPARDPKQYTNITKKQNSDAVTYTFCKIKT